MKKIIKLLLLGVVIIGAIVGLMLYIAPSKKDEPKPDITSAAAKKWQTKVDSICNEGKWTVSAYQIIQNGVHSDYKASKGEELSKDEEIALNKYLFSASCSYLFTVVDSHFRQKSYDAGKINSYGKMADFLKTEVESRGQDSNLSEADAILSQYTQLLSLMKVRTPGAVYSQPLRRYSGGNAEGAKNKIVGMKYYKAYFSKNPSIKSKVDNMVPNRAQAEAEYYANLERAIEDHFRKTHDWMALQDDLIQFTQISTNQSAISRLNSFTKNQN